MTEPYRALAEAVLMQAARDYWQRPREQAEIIAWAMSEGSAPLFELSGIYPGEYVLALMEVGHE